MINVSTSYIGLNIFILARLRNKFLQLILITFESASWNQPVLVSYEETYGRDPSGARTDDLWVERQTP
jgi:hypothetical protein